MTDTPKLYSFPLLSRLGDTKIVNTTNQQTIQYNSTNKKWENNLVDINNLGGININNPLNLEVLFFNGSEWTNGPISAIPTDLDNLADVNITAVQNRQLLYYDGINQLWANGNIALSDLDDIVFTSLATNDVL